jgi:hypothetical protein
MPVRERKRRFAGAMWAVRTPSFSSLCALDLGCRSLLSGRNCSGADRKGYPVKRRLGTYLTGFVTGSIRERECSLACNILNSSRMVHILLAQLLRTRVPLSTEFFRA